MTDKLLDQKFFHRAKKKVMQQFLKDTSHIYLLERGLLRGIETRPAKAMAPIYADMWFLYQTVRKERPGVILEFGSGCSTQVMAHALLKNQQTLGLDGYLYSLEVDDHYVEVTRNHIPTYLQGFYEVVPSEVVDGEHEDTPVVRHTNIPDVAPDMIYLDSPAFAHREVPKDTPGSYGYNPPPLMDGTQEDYRWVIPGPQVAADILDMEEHLPIGCVIVVDGRHTNKRYLEKHLKREWEFAQNEVLNNSRFTLIK